MNFIACSRMYDVTPDVRGHWHALLRAAADAAGLAVDCVDHAAPAPLTDLWARDDLALAFICGLPLATRYPRLRPLAAPVTVLTNGDSPVYRSVWLVRADSAFDSLASTFGQRIGWTVDHSHSGFNAPRHALEAFRSEERPRLYIESIGPLGHPRAALGALRDGQIDVTAIDAYWWWLMQRRDTGTAAPFRAIGYTAEAPMPPLACGAELPVAQSIRLAQALVRLHEVAGLRAHLDALGIRRFASMTRDRYEVLAGIDRDARAAGYPLPA